MNKAVVGLNSTKGKALLAVVLPFIREGGIYLTPAQHAGLCEILDRGYPLGGGEKHKGGFVFGMPVVLIPALRAV
jgi:hypothetical protein